MRSKAVPLISFHVYYSPLSVSPYIYVVLFLGFFLVRVQALPMLKSIICFEPCKQIGHCLCTAISKAKSS